METVNIKTIQLDLKKPKLTTIGDFIQNDTNIIKFTLTDNGSVIDLDIIDQILINYKKPSGEIVSRIVTAEADVITYQLGLAEMSEPGIGKLVIQFFKSDNRISTFTVDVNIKKTIESNFTFEETEKGLVDQVIQKISRLEATNNALLTRILLLENIINNGEIPNNENSITFGLVDGELLATYSKIVQELGVTIELVNGELIAKDNSNSVDFGRFNISEGQLLVTYPN